MKEQDQHIELCRFWGWTRVRIEVWDSELGHEPTGICPKYLVRQPLRMFNTLSLDVLHEVEKRLNADQWEGYRETLSDICKDECRIGIAISANAQERREALLRTLGLWKEQPIPQNDGLTT